MNKLSETMNLYELKSIHTNEVDRLVALEQKGKSPYPPTSLNTFTLDDLRYGFEQINFNPKLLLEKSRQYFEALFDKKPLDPKIIADLFSSGEKHCLVALPYDESGLPANPANQDPLTFPRRLRLGPDNQTFGFGRPAYYFLSFPPEIQNSCVFTVPSYQNSRMPSPEEIKILEQSFWQAFNNLEQLLTTLN